MILMRRVLIDTWSVLVVVFWAILLVLAVWAGRAVGVRAERERCQQLQRAFIKIDFTMERLAEACEQNEGLVVREHGRPIDCKEP